MHTNNKIGPLEIIDISNLTFNEKRSTVQEIVNQSSEGEEHIIRDNISLKEVYDHLLKTFPDSFNWEHLEIGPKIWKVKLTIKKDPMIELTIGELVKEDYRKAEVLKKYGLDFCCGGKKTLAKACEEKGIDVMEISKDFHRLEDSGSYKPSRDFNKWSLDFLADYIVNTHHSYVRQANQALYGYTQKLKKVHGEKHPELVEIANIFSDIMNELESHMVKEENILFPYIKNMVEAKKQSRPTIAPPFRTVQNPINMMEHEHKDAMELMKRIETLSDGYTVPTDACNTYRVAYAKLREYDDDLRLHMHLESNILFPKAIDLENAMIRTGN